MPKIQLITFVRIVQDVEYSPEAYGDMDLDIALLVENEIPNAELMEYVIAEFGVADEVNIYRIQPNEQPPAIVPSISLMRSARLKED